jgi:rhamnose transport system permease protein
VLLIRPETMTLGLLIVAILVASKLSPFFSDIGFILESSTYYVEYAIVALVLTLVIISGEIDLSPASMMALSACVFAASFKAGVPIELAIVLSLATGVIMGLFNALLVIGFQLPSIIVTIGTLTLYRGLAFVILGDTAVADLPTQYTDWAFGTFAGTQIPNPFIVFVVLAVIFGFVLHRTTFGRSLFAIGANEEAAFFSGVRVKRIKLGLFVLSGVIAALAGVIFALRFGSARADNGTGLELSVVAVVLLGGVSIFGGKGHLLGVIVAVLLLGAIRSALTINDVADEVLTIVTGSLLLLSVLGPSAAARLRERGRGDARPPVEAGAGAAH